MWKKIIFPAVVVVVVLIVLISSNFTGQNNEKRLQAEGIVTDAVPVSVMKHLDPNANTTHRNTNRFSERYRYSPMFKYVVEGESFNIYGKNYIHEDSAEKILHEHGIKIRYVKSDPSIAEVILPEEKK